MTQVHFTQRHFNRDREISDWQRVAQQRHLLGDLKYAEKLYKLILANVPAHHEALLGHTRLMIQQNRFAEALAITDRYLSYFGINEDVCYLRALAYFKIGDRASSSKEIYRALSVNADYIECYHLLTEIEMRGPKYRNLLQEIHAKLQPHTYVEIGIQNGTTLKLASARNVIGIDPSPRIEGDLPPNFQIFKLESDSFFYKWATKVLGGHRIDLAFIDGLHESHQALRDFVNVERFASETGVILVHDVIPLNAETSTPERNTSFWTGDVWRTILAIKRYFHDIEFFTIDSPPTGITLIKNLNPNRGVSNQELQDMYSYMDSLKYSDIKETKFQNLKVEQYDSERLSRFLSGSSWAATKVDAS